MTHSVLEDIGEANFTSATIKRMWELVNRAKTDEKFQKLIYGIVNQAMPGKTKDYRGELNVIFSWARKAVNYRRDPYGVELVQDVWATLDRARGDCDDFSVLLSAAAEVLGAPSRIITISTRSNKEPNHVYPQANIGGRWVGMDATVHGSFLGWDPRQFTDKKIWTRRDVGLSGGEDISDVEGLGMMPYRSSMFPETKPSSPSPWGRAQAYGDGPRGDPNSKVAQTAKSFARPTVPSTGRPPSHYSHLFGRQWGLSRAPHPYGAAAFWGQPVPVAAPSVQAPPAGMEPVPEGAVEEYVEGVAGYVMNRLAMSEIGLSDIDSAINEGLRMTDQTFRSSARMRPVSHVLAPNVSSDISETYGDYFPGSAIVSPRRDRAAQIANNADFTGNPRPGGGVYAPAYPIRSMPTPRELWYTQPRMSIPRPLDPIRAWGQPIPTAVPDVQAPPAEMEPASEVTMENYLVDVASQPGSLIDGIAGELVNQIAMGEIGMGDIDEAIDDALGELGGRKKRGFGKKKRKHRGGAPSVPTKLPSPTSLPNAPSMTKLPAAAPPGMPELPGREGLPSSGLTLPTSGPILPYAPSMPGGLPSAPGGSLNLPSSAMQMPGGFPSSDLVPKTALNNPGGLFPNQFQMPDTQMPRPMQLSGYLGDTITDVANIVAKAVTTGQVPTDAASINKAIDSTLATGAPAPAKTTVAQVAKAGIPIGMLAVVAGIGLLMGGKKKSTRYQSNPRRRPQSRGRGGRGKKGGVDRNLVLMGAVGVGMYFLFLNPSTSVLPKAPVKPAAAPAAPPTATQAMVAAGVKAAPGIWGAVTNFFSPTPAPAPAPAATQKPAADTWDSSSLVATL